MGNVQHGKNFSLTQTQHTVSSFTLMLHTGTTTERASKSNNMATTFMLWLANMHANLQLGFLWDYI